MSTARRIFRYSCWDALPALCGVGIVALLITTFVGFHSLPGWFLAVSFVAVAWSYCWNMQCISHNFIHNSFFANEWLNRAFAVLESLALGVPHILYHHYHLNHHWGDSDAQGPDGSTRDWSSIYRFGKNGQPEGFIRYCLISFFRVEVGPVLRVCVRHGRQHVLQCIAESLALGAFWVTMALVDWRYLVYFYLPSYYLGWVLSYAEGYLEHYNAQPGNYFANSVSSYNWIYNLLWFNNGYHQEHHWDPKVHWTQMRDLHRQIQPQLDANHARTLRGPHITALIEYWWSGRQRASLPNDSQAGNPRAAA
jgi:fatty acid desaturase